MRDNSPRPQAGRNAGWIPAGALAALVLAAGTATAAPTVVFTATDLPDAVVGADTWRYDFTVSGSAAADESVNLLFLPNSYADLLALDVDPALTVLTTQPDAGLPADGMVQAIFAAALTGPLSFATSFTWLGAGTPGALPFEVLDANFSVAGTGQTRPAIVVDVPEPPMAATVLVLAAAAMVWRRRAAGRG